MPATDIAREPELVAAEQALMKATSPSLLPMFRGAQMSEAFHAYRELQHALDDAMPDQLIDIRGRLFRKKGYWRAIATAFNLNVACIREESDTGGWRVVYRASLPSGRFAEGDGACEFDEKGKGQDSEHNVRSHAHTRAFNRAVSNLVGFGEVSAEEVRSDRAPVHVAAPATADRFPAEPPGGDRGSLPPGFVRIQDYRFTDNGWHEVTVAKQDAQDGAVKFTTKNACGAVAGRAFEAGLPVKLTSAPKRGGKGEAFLNAVEVWDGEPFRSDPA